MQKGKAANQPEQTSLLKQMKKKSEKAINVSCDISERESERVSAYLRSGEGERASTGKGEAGGKMMKRNKDRREQE